MSMKVAGYLAIAFALMMAALAGLEWKGDNWWSTGVDVLLAVVGAQSAAQNFIRVGMDQMRDRAGR